MPFRHQLPRRHYNGFSFGAVLKRDRGMTWNIVALDGLT
jgi:hypothetical protein